MHSKVQQCRAYLCQNLSCGTYMSTSYTEMYDIFPCQAGQLHPPLLRPYSGQKAKTDTLDNQAEAAGQLQCLYFRSSAAHGKTVPQIQRQRQLRDQLLSLSQVQNPQLNGNFGPSSSLDRRTLGKVHNSCSCEPCEQKWFR